MKIAFLNTNIKLCKVLFQHRVMKDLVLLKFWGCRNSGLRHFAIRGCGNDCSIYHCNFIWDENYAANLAIFVEIVVIAVLLFVFTAVI